jgi:hypothetical protein
MHCFSRHKRGGARFLAGDLRLDSKRPEYLSLYHLLIRPCRNWYESYSINRIRLCSARLLLSVGSGDGGTRGCRQNRYGGRFSTRLETAKGISRQKTAWRKIWREDYFNHRPSSSIPYRSQHHTHRHSPLHFTIHGHDHDHLGPATILVPNFILYQRRWIDHPNSRLVNNKTYYRHQAGRSSFEKVLPLSSAVRQKTKHATSDNQSSTPGDDVSLV